MTRKSKPTSSQVPSPTQRLSSKRELNLIAALAANLSKSGLKPLSSAVLLSLAQRGLIPDKLNGTPAGLLIKRLAASYFNVTIEESDTSELANCLAQNDAGNEQGLIDSVLLDADNFAEVEQNLERFKSIETILLEPILLKTIADPLFCGWLYQTILMGRDDYSLSRKERSTSGVSRITQWFTPNWICKFLLDECFNDSSADSKNVSKNGSSRTTEPVTFLDSACGAGHILAPALVKLLTMRLSDSNVSDKSKVSDTTNVYDNTNAHAESAYDVKSTDEIRNHFVKNYDEQEISMHLSEVLSTQLYGCDLDPLMVRLSGLAVYLTCRDISRSAPLPIPLIFSFCDVQEIRNRQENTTRSSGQDTSTRGSQIDDSGDKQTESNSNADNGSLILSLDPRPSDVLLRRIDGTTTSLDCLPKTYDMQCLNPPYLSHRLMPKASASFLRQNYDGSQYDLYTAFLELSIRLMAPHSRLALICQQSFLSTSRFEHLRRQLVERCHINSIVQLGAGAFASRGGEKVSNAIVSLSRRTTGEDTHQMSVYKLVSVSAKEQAEQDGVGGYVKETFCQTELLTTTRMVPGFPLVPFCPKEVAILFQTHPTIADSDNEIILTNGLFTCDNKRFVRHFSEVSALGQIPFVPYDKGGGQKWFSTTPYMLEWSNNGDDIREFRLQRGQSKALPGERFYFQHGITYSYIGTRGFKARLLSPGSVFDIASSAMFSERIDLFYMLGFLNSSLTRFILGMLNPTVNFQIGDLRRLPFCVPQETVEQEVARLAKEAVGLAREAETFDPSSPAYNQALKGAATDSRIAVINQSELRLQNAIDEIIFDLYKITSTTRDIIRENEWVCRTQGDLIARGQRSI